MRTLVLKDFRGPILVGFLFIAVMVVSFYAVDSRQPIASAETRFVETSASGLQIVPASCPSNPHYNGQCSNGDGDDVCPNDAGVQQTGPCAGGCPVGYISLVTGCWFVGCPSGFTYNSGTGLCERGGGQCTPQNVCGSGQTFNMVVNSCSGAVIDDCTENGPSWFCSGGQCVGPDPQGGQTPGAWINVSPALVRSGETTLVTWSSEDMSYCEVSENNPLISDSWDTEFGSERSSAITQRTTYSLHCDGDFIDSATVNVIPIFIET